MADRDPSESGVLVYPRAPVPKPRPSDPKISSTPEKRSTGGSIDKMRIILGVVGLVLGIVIGFLLRPAIAPDSRIGALEDAVAAEKKATATQKERADTAEKSLEAAQKSRDAVAQKLKDAEAAQKELAGKVADTDAKAKEAEEQRKKLEAAIEKGAGIVSADGEEIHLRLVDRVLFALNDDKLTDKGKVVIDKVAAALKEIPDKQIWVQGHTDDQPIINLPPKPQPPPKKGQKPLPPPAGPRFATNWELSAARALTVVHYLQDVSKIEPSRLAALAFGQYRPLSRGDKSANRRIEIVLYPKPIVKK